MESNTFGFNRASKAVWQLKVSFWTCSWFLADSINVSACLCETLLARYRPNNTTNSLCFSMKFSFYNQARIESDIQWNLKFSCHLIHLRPPVKCLGSSRLKIQIKGHIKVAAQSSVSGLVAHCPAQSLPNSAKLLPSRLLLCSDKPDAVYFAGCRLRSCRSRAPLSCQSNPIFWQLQSRGEIGSFLPIQTSAIYIRRCFPLQRIGIDQLWLGFRCSQELLFVLWVLQRCFVCDILQLSRGQWIL